MDQFRLHLRPHLRLPLLSLHRHLRCQVRQLRLLQESAAGEVCAQTARRMQVIGATKVWTTAGSVRVSGALQDDCRSFQFVHEAGGPAKHTMVH